MYRKQHRIEKKLLMETTIDHRRWSKRCPPQEGQPLKKYMCYKLRQRKISLGIREVINPTILSSAIIRLMGGDICMDYGIVYLFQTTTFFRGIAWYKVYYSCSKELYSFFSNENLKQNMIFRKN